MRRNFAGGLAGGFIGGLAGGLAGGLIAGARPYPAYPAYPVPLGGPGIWKKIKFSDVKELIM